MISAVFAILFGVSLLPGRKPLCLRFAERISDGIMPDGAEAYCRKLTWVWFFVLLANAAASVALVAFFGGLVEAALPRVIAACALSAVVVGGTFAIEGIIRARRFSVTFHTSGSTAKPKTIVKTFASLAKEVAFHRARLADVLARKPVFLSTVEPHHMYGILWRVLLPKAAGCTVDPEVILTPESLLKKMRAAESVFLVTTPSFLARFVEYAYLYDVDTGIKLRIKRMGGSNHADVEPATKADTTKLKQIAGGKFSWTCHAGILMANGQYVACSYNTMPHGDQTIKDNGYDGQFCLHMVGSKTHGSDKVNPNHQACIDKAYKWAHG